LSNDTLINCTLANNHANDGGAIYVTQGTAELVNAILWHNTATGNGAQLYTYDATCTVEHSNIETGWNGPGVYAYGTGGATDGTGNINADPGFTDPQHPLGNDTLFATADDGCKPEPNSLCTDAANGHRAPPCDVLDLARADHPHITNTGTGQPDYADMGAYEIVTAWYVDANADPNGNGLAWTHAFQNLQNALDAARAGDLVLVADGDYTGPQNRNLHFNGKALTLRSVNGPSHCVIDAQGQSRVFQIGPADIGSRVEGFTIKGGDVCEGGAGVDCTGGSLTIADCVLTNNRPYALHCSAATSLTLQDCTLSNGTTGLRAVDQAQVQLDHCTITSHLYDGITVTDQACVTLNDSTIADNREGVHAVAGSVRLTACTIKDNREYGLYTNTTDPNVTDCTFTANGWGSTTYPAVYCGGSQYAQFVRCQLTDNIGPGLYCWGSSVTFERGRITGNGGSGVILATGDTSTIIQSVIANNAGDGVTVEDSSPTVTNCTVADNTSAGVRSAYSGSPTINNTILWSNGDDDLIDCSASYTCVQDYHAANNNLPGPPHFVDPNVADYHLQPWSSCIDAGDPASACDAEPGHTPGNTINLGAYGNTDEATQRSDADTDTDGLYDAWEQHYWPGSGLAAQDANSDPDGDGLVNLVEQQVRHHNKPTDGTRLRHHRPSPPVGPTRPNGQRRTGHVPRTTRLQRQKYRAPKHRPDRPRPRRRNRHRRRRPRRPHLFTRRNLSLSRGGPYRHRSTARRLL